MSIQGPTVKQHFVPQFYLKNFADLNKNLHVYNVKDKRLEKTRSYSGLGYAKFFYAAETGIHDDLSQKIEDWLHTYENIISQKLPDIIKKILEFEHITEDDKYFLSALMCMLWLRSPKMRNQLNDMHKDVTKQVMGFNARKQVTRYIEETKSQISDIEREKFINDLETVSYDLHFSNVQHLRFMIDTFGFYEKGFTNMFYGHNWKIYIAKGQQRFITSDSPVVEWWIPPNSFYGPTFLERNKYFALTPEIFITLGYPFGSEKVNRKTLFEKDDEMIKMYNILISAHSQKYAYSGEKKLLEELISGRSKPGKVESEYYEKFQLPWTKFRKQR